jgi:spore germination protein YaaH
MIRFPYIYIVVALFALVVPIGAFAEEKERFEISGWIPYWRSGEGVESILPEITAFTEINPFLFTVTTDGRLHQASKLTSSEWRKLQSEAKQKGVRFIPTIMWANADAMHTVFSSPTKRQEHIRSIVSAVFTYNLDGIDIDYEAKYARTRPFFSLFLKELYEAMGYNKWVMCTIESRTPLDSRYSKLESIPTDIEYANDFVEINKYCDRVRIMAYDQGRIDLKLNKENTDPYAPVADVRWVEKTMRLAAEEIDPKKLVIGVPTYGYEYDVFTSLTGSGETEYSRLWSLNPKYYNDVISKLNLTPYRDSSGELSVTYPATKAIDGIVPLPFATRIISWSDASAIQDKVKLAKELGMRGVAIFKIDGGQDPKLWDILSEYKDTTLAAASAWKPVDVGLGTRELASASLAISLAIPLDDLEYGDREESVRLLQKFLNAKGFVVSGSGAGSLGSETTFFGPATRDALIRFQKAHGVRPAIGYYGPITRAAMKLL